MRNPTRMTMGGMPQGSPDYLILWFWYFSDRFSAYAFALGSDLALGRLGGSVLDWALVGHGLEEEFYKGYMPEHSLGRLWLSQILFAMLYCGDYTYEAHEFYVTVLKLRPEDIHELKMNVGSNAEGPIVYDVGIPATQGFPEMPHYAEAEEALVALVVSEEALARKRKRPTWLKAHTPAGSILIAVKGYIENRMIMVDVWWKLILKANECTRLMTQRTANS